MLKKTARLVRIPNLCSGSSKGEMSVHRCNPWCYFLTLPSRLHNPFHSPLQIFAGALDKKDLPRHSGFLQRNYYDDESMETPIVKKSFTHQMIGSRHWADKKSFSPPCSSGGRWTWRIVSGSEFDS